MVRYVNSGRVEAGHATSSPRRVTQRLCIHPDRLDGDQHALLGELTGVCTQMEGLAAQVRAFAELLIPPPTALCC
ncbi:hypothetical protein AB0942_34850 [Streptomyces nodosus]|uniref:hypothetical protein n=1 Tax=Streptomyces nodosus TaxID=40318 RepID=UPI00345112F4